MKPFVSHDEAVCESFRKDPELAAEFLNTVLEDGDQQEILAAIKQVVKAFCKDGDTDSTLEKSNVLYEALSPTFNPKLKNIQQLLSKIGMKLAVTPAV